MMRMFALLMAVVMTMAGIGAAASAPTSAPAFEQRGERWTYRGEGKSFDGILVKPQGAGPFPAVLISHGMGGDAAGFAMPKARALAALGFVSIAPNYTHSIRNLSGQQRPVPGDPEGPGASEENLRRAEECMEYVRSLPFVDAKRLYAYGHSMGGFVTIGLAARQPALLTKAAVSGSGVAPRSGFAAPSVESAKRIRTPFCIIHGGDDRTVPPERSAMLQEVLVGNDVACERHVFPGVDHPVDQQRPAEVLELLSYWFSN